MFKYEKICNKPSSKRKDFTLASRRFYYKPYIHKRCARLFYNITRVGELQNTKLLLLL